MRASWLLNPLCILSVSITPTALAVVPNGGGVSATEAWSEGSHPGDVAASSVSIVTQIQTMGFTVLDGAVAVSGLVSNARGALLEDIMGIPALGPSRVVYSSSIGAVPSPGGNGGRPFDLAALGYKVTVGPGHAPQLVVIVASGLDPENWLDPPGLSNAEFGVGDLFIELDNNGTIEHFAMLNSVNSGTSVNGHGTYFNAAQSFRTGSGPPIGELVRLSTEADLIRTGQAYSYTFPGPSGLDTRLMAIGGTGIGVGAVSFSSMVADQPLGGGAPMTWYLTEWTVPIAAFGITGKIDLTLHVATSCGNDTINGALSTSYDPVPATSAWDVTITILVLMAGLSVKFGTAMRPTQRGNRAIAKG